MQTLHDKAISSLINPSKNKVTGTERFLNNLRNSSIGIAKNDVTSKGLDTFEISENISELLSPACGMTDKEKEEYMSSIMRKLQSGKRLTAEEMRFLQSENPQLYQQVARVEKMRDSLEQQLKNCNSKQEVNQVYARSVSMVGDEDPMKQYIIAAYNDVKEEFQQTDEYKNLPEKTEN